MTPIKLVMFSTLGMVSMLSMFSTATAQTARAQPPLQPLLDSVKKLYESAAYDEALGQLDQVLQQDSTLAQANPAARTVQQYRALCLLALNRTPEAEQAMERLIIANPDYQPDANEASPRLVSIFSRARARVVPVLARKGYVRAKALFDQHQYTEAAAEFTRVIARLDDGALDPATAAATGDLRLLASGFLELSRAALLQARPLVPVAATRPPDPAAAIVDKVCTLEDRDVVPPVSIRQELPQWTHQPFGVDVRFEGQIDIVVDEKGDVASVNLAKSIQPSYDDVAVAAAKSWKYAPATRNGVPVKFRKSVGIVLFAH
jgi:TonB family protein